MLNDITLGQYIPSNSLIHRLDPRTKIIGLLLYISGIFIVESYLAYAFLGAFGITVVKLSEVPIKMILKSLKPLWFIVLFTALIHLFVTPGTPIMTVGSFTMTWEGLDQGLLMGIRLLLLMSFATLLTYTTSPIALTDAIERLLKPLSRFGVPAHELAMMMTIALRFIPTLIDETDRIMKAQRSRGADFSSGSLLRRVRCLIPLLVPLFISAFRRADELAVAMEARCYRGGDHRTRMRTLEYTSLDRNAYIAIFVLLAIIVAIRIGRSYYGM